MPSKYENEFASASPQETIRTLTAIISALCLAVMVPLNGWALMRLVDHGERIGRIETQVGTGPVYHRYDADRDQSVVLRILESQNKTIEDHEGRLRIVERAIK